MVFLLIIGGLILLTVIVSSVGIYFYLKDRRQPRPTINIKVVQIPTGTVLTSISDAQQICQSQGYRIATIDDILGAMSLIDYTYCTRGYVDNATIIPVSPNASSIGCPNPGLNEQAPLFPCAQGQSTSQDPKCAQVVFCISDKN